MKKLLEIAFFMYVLPVHAQKVILLDNKGSEKWSWNEKENKANAFNTPIVYNVSHATLSVFPADTGTANGTAIVICPGGAFQILSIESEGNEVARWLNKRGITAFVLKYRLSHTISDEPIKKFFNRAKLHHTRD